MIRAGTEGTARPRCGWSRATGGGRRWNWRSPRRTTSRPSWSWWRTRVAAGGSWREWSSGPGGWRPADRWLRETYRDVAGGVIAPAGLYGAMVIGGAGFLLRLQDRFRADGTRVTEAHPKVCYRALTGRKAAWNTDREQMTAWLIGELGVGRAEEIHIAQDHRFDAATAALAALRGLTGDWALDLHALPDADPSRRIRFCGPTHYWWPQPPKD